MGCYPKDFTERVERDLDGSKGEPRLGAWAPWDGEGVPHDFTALATWLRPGEPTHLRALIGSRWRGRPERLFAGEDGVLRSPRDGDGDNRD